MLQKFYVNNYKCLVDVEIPLTPIHVIIGQNDSGKTSVLEAILALFRSTEKPLVEAFPGEWQGRELVFDGEEKPVVQLQAEVAPDQGDGPLPISYKLDVEFAESGRACHRIDESCGIGEFLAIPMINPQFSGIFRRAGRFSGAHKDYIDAIAVQLRSASLYRFNPELMAIPAAIDPARKFRMDPDGFGLATLLDDILGYDAESFLALRRDFCAFFPQFRTVRIESVQSLARTYQENGQHHAASSPGKGIFFETAHGRSIRAQQASDGAILFLGLLALIHSPYPPKLLLIEEPEKGVYPKRLEEVIRLIRRVHEAPSVRAAPQIIMTTHSPYLLSSFRPEEVTLMVRRDGVGPVQARPLRDAPHIEERLGNEFYLGELWYNLSEEELFADA